jgi:hypothetical protein
MDATKLLNMSIKANDCDGWRVRALEAERNVEARDEYIAQLEAEIAEAYANND